MTVIGLIILLIGVVSALSQVYGGMLTDKFGENRFWSVDVLSCITFVILAFLINAQRLCGYW